GSNCDTIDESRIRLAFESHVCATGSLVNKRSPRVRRERGWRDQLAVGGLTGLAGFLAFGVAGFLADAGLVDAGFAATGLAGFLVFGLMLTGRPAGGSFTTTGSGSGRKNRLHSGESCARLATMQALTRSMSGISEPHRRNASGWQAACSSAVWAWPARGNAATV